MKLAYHDRTLSKHEAHAHPSNWNEHNTMNNYLKAIFLASALAVPIIITRQSSPAQDPAPGAAGETNFRKPNLIDGALRENPSVAAFVTEIPPGYRDWKLISLAREEGDLDDIRAVLGNEIAIQAYRAGTLPFPEGAIIARLAWSYLPSEENNQAFGRAQSFVAGDIKNGLQFMVKDSVKYAATGGWGYGHFEAGKPATAKTLQSCFPCHESIADRDFVFTRYSP